MKKIGALLFPAATDANLGWLFLRLAIGCGILTHGLPKLLAGPALWTGLGGVMVHLGAPGPAVFWGFMAAFAEGGGGALLVFGALTRGAAFLIAFTMSIAFFVHHAADPFATKELAFLYLSGALAMLLKGGGRYSVDALIRKKLG